MRRDKPAKEPKNVTGNTGPSPTNDMRPWHYTKSRVAAGPVSRAELNRLIQAGELTAADLVWNPALPNWQSIGDTPELALLVGAAHEPPSTTSVPVAAASARAPFADSTAEVRATPGPGRRRSYIVRHWRGELSLGKSYWLNGMLMGVFVAVLSTAVSRMDVAAHPRVYSLTVIVLLLLVTPLLATWQWVGVWRSANHHVERGGKRAWAVLAEVMVVVGVLSFAGSMAATYLPASAQYWRILTDTDPMSHYEVRVIRDDTELEVRGPIGFGLTDRVREELDAHPTITLIHLNSPGGRVAEARALAKLIEDRGLSTYTATGCASACILPFMAGRQRLINGDARLGFHQYGFPGVRGADFSGQYATDEAYLRTRGIAPNFVARAYATPNRSLWKPSLAELAAAHVITGEAAAGQVGLSGLSPADAKSVFDREPLYASLKQTDPTVYTSLLGMFQDAAAKGHSLLDAQASMMPTLWQLRAKRLPYASNTAVIGFSALAVAEWQYLEKTDPVVCFDYEVGDTQTTMRAAALLPLALTAREPTVLAEVLRSGKNQAFAPASAATANDLLQRIGTDLKARFGDDTKLIGELSNPNIDKAKGCALLIALYQDILRLPSTESGPLLRYMYHP